MAKLLCRFLLWLSGWKVTDNIPPESTRCVMIAAPHTSNWDAYYLKLTAVVLEIPLKVAIKDTWTKGILGWFIKWMGGLGINRAPKGGTKRLSQVESMANLFKDREKISLVIAPEGTRKRREQWKMGFYWVAKTAGVPITFGFLDYENKLAGVGSSVVHPSDDMNKDMQVISEFYRNIKGKFPENFQLDERYDQTI